MRKFLFALFLVLIVSSPALSGNYYKDGEVLAVFRVPDGLQISESGARVANIAASVNASIAENYETLSEVDGQIFVLIRSENKTTQELIDSLKANPEVISVSPNYYIYSSEIIIPNDPSVDQCWGLDKIRAPEVWPNTTGSKNIYVCVIDSGMYKHPDLLENISLDLCQNFATVSGEHDLNFTSWDVDRVAHGTHVAGTIGAVGNNNIGVAGVNWQVSLFSVRIFDDNEYETISKEIRAINYIISILQKYPDLKLAAINMSLSACLPVTPEKMCDDVYYMAFKALDNLDWTLVIAGAGNSGLEINKPAPFDDPTSANDFKTGGYFYPANFTGLKNFITVSAIDSSDLAAHFTNWGESVDISAPGVGILSTYSPLVNNRLYRVLSGTSMAAPHVTGAAALLLSAFPDATPQQIKSALLNGANKDINPVVYPFAYQVKIYLESAINRIDSQIKSGDIPAESRDLQIKIAEESLKKIYADYEQLDGTGRVSKNGLLDVKAAYDILESEFNNSEPVNYFSGSGGGGCNINYSFICALIVLCVILSIKKIL